MSNRHAAWDNLPKGWTQDSVESFWKSLTGDKDHKITECMLKMEGKVTDPGAFCGSLASAVGYRKEAEALARDFLNRHSAEEPARLRSLYSSTARRELIKAFTLRGMPFFEFYDTVRWAELGNPAPAEGYEDTFHQNMRLIARMLSLESTRTRLIDSHTELRPLLHRLDQGADDHQLFVRVARILGPLMMDVALDQGVYLTTMSAGAPGWFMFRVMSEKEKQVDDLKRTDPDAYDLLQKARQLRVEVDKNIEKTILESGWVPSRREIRGKPVMVGSDPVSGDELVFDNDGEFLSMDQYITKRNQANKQRDRLTKVFPKLEDLPKLTDEELEVFTSGELEYMAMTDDKAKSHNLTRIYPVKKTIEGRTVVVSGRFKGFYMEDLVNRAGRMIEGVAYDLEPKTGIPLPIETRDPNTGALNVRANREPFVTVTSDKKLYLKIPATRQYTNLRNAVAKLAEIVPSLIYEKDSRKTTFTFEPKDFAAVREALGSVALSGAAMKLLREYFSQLAKHELALSDENLKYFSADKIGGFKPNVKLYHKQKEALAWVESRKHSGVVALDTGLGKTASSIAIMQKMVRDNLLTEGQKFLYVCPTALKGNLPSEITNMIEDPKALIERVDVMDYGRFTKEVKANPNFADRYAAVFFDEAQALKNPTSGPSVACQTLKHPKKILLTASPMEKSPMELFSLAAVSNNINLNTTEGRAAMKAFRKRFCEEVGGKIMGIKNDPLTARDFRVWVKQNIYFADKRDVEEIALPSLKKETVVVTMDPQVETLYRGITKGISTTMQGMVSKYRDRNPKMTDPGIEAARIKLAKQFRQLFMLTHFPEKFVPGAKNPKIEQSINILDERVAAGRKSILFTDNPELAKTTAETLSKRFPGHLHAECGAAAIKVWQSGTVVQTYRAAAYKEGDRVWPKEDWKVYVVNRIINTRPDFMTATLTSTYAVGQNLQSFDTVIHLDRDAFNNETMKQRTSRAWRGGQQNSVDEIILDVVYDQPVNDKDATLDQIASYMQGLEAELFDTVVLESQVEALGKEWFTMAQKHSSFTEVNRRHLELLLSPYASRVGEAGSGNKV